MSRSILNDKIGLILWYFAKDISNLSMTKALKLLYIVDETSVKETGAPVTWLDYRVWKMGPVAVQIYEEASTNKPTVVNGIDYSLEKYIQVRDGSYRGRPTKEIRPVGEHDLNELSEYEFELIKKVLFKFGNLSSEQLINYLHKENSLWHRLVERHNLQELFDSISFRSDVAIDFNELNENDNVKLFSFQSEQENLAFYQRFA